LTEHPFTVFTKDGSGQAFGFTRLCLIAGNQFFRGGIKELTEPGINNDIINNVNNVKGGYL